MKLYRRFIRHLKRCLFLAGFVLSTGFAISSWTISREARAVLAEESTEEEPENIIEAIDKQLRETKDAVGRYKRSYEEAVKHRAYELEIKRQEVEEMKAVGYELNGDIINDSITLARYKMRQIYLYNNLELGNLASDEEILLLASINDKLIENVPLTPDEKLFYAAMKGTRHQYETFQDMNQLDNTIMPSIEASNFDSTYTSIEPRIGLDKGRTAYIFESQTDAIVGVIPYLQTIKSDPGNYVVRINNQRNTVFTHNILSADMIEVFNKNNIAIIVTQDLSTTRIAFKKGGINNNDIPSFLSPYKQRKVTDYMDQKKRDDILVEDMERFKEQQRAEEINALTEQESTWTKIKNIFKK